MYKGNTRQHVTSASLKTCAYFLFPIELGQDRAAQYNGVELYIQAASDTVRVHFYN